MGLYQTKTFCTAKETINKMKRAPTEWENTFAKDTSDKELIYHNSTSNKQTNKQTKCGFKNG